MSTNRDDRPTVQATETTSLPSDTGSDISPIRRFGNLRTFISFAIAAVLLAFLITRTDIDLGRTWREINSANLWYLLAGLVVYYVTFPLRAVRWRLLLTNVGFRPDEILGTFDLGRIIFISWFANCLVPAKLGDVYRAYLMKRSAGISLTKAGGTIAAERIIDFATVIVLIAITALISFRGRLPPQVETLVMTSAILVLVAVLGLIVMNRWPVVVTSLLPHRFKGIYDRFREGAIGSFGNNNLLFLFTLLVWITEPARLFLVTRSIGFSLNESLPLEIAMISFLALGAALLTAPPGTPAGFGYVEAGLYTALVLLGAQPEVALTITALDRAISWISIVVLGAPVYALYRYK